MKDQKYKSHMLDPSRDVKNMRVKNPKNPVILYGMHSEIIPREVAMLELNNHIHLASRGEIMILLVNHEVINIMSPIG
jgi:hypothetical protein